MAACYKSAMAKVLTLSGWAQSPDALREVCPVGTKLTCCDYSEHDDFASLCEALEGQRYDAVMGWSLGGQLAVNLLVEKTIQAEKLILLCAPHQFVRDETAPYAMEAWLFEQFYENYTSSPERTAKRFSGLIAKGDARTKEVIKELLPHSALHEVERWKSWLKLLGETSIDQGSLTNLPETLIIHGNQDSLVKVEQGEWFARHIKSSHLEQLADSAHAPHLHDAKMVASLIEEFVDG